VSLPRASVMSTGSSFFLNWIFSSCLVLLLASFWGRLDLSFLLHLQRSVVFSLSSVVSGLTSLQVRSASRKERAGYLARFFDPLSLLLPECADAFQVHTVRSFVCCPEVFFFLFQTFGPLLPACAKRFHCSSSIFPPSLLLVLTQSAGLSRLLHLLSTPY